MSDPLRFFVPTESMQGDQVVIIGEPFHHLRNVLRVKPGAIILLLDGFGLCCEVRLERLQSVQATARVMHRWQEANLALPITLLQAMPKGDKFELVLQKGTELGVSCFKPLETCHAVPNLSGPRLQKREQRWQRIVREASRQSRRSYLPEVRSIQQLAAALEEPCNDLKLVLWEAGSIPLAAVLPELAPAGISLLVGPEGGFSAAEINTIRAAGFRAVHLGPRILRTETAGLAATPILQYLYGDWQHPPLSGSSSQHEESL